MLAYRLAILAAAVLWSSAGAAIKLSGLSAWQIGGGRSLVAATFLLLGFAGARRRPTGRILAVGAAYAATTLLFVLANKMTTAANAIFIQDAAPLFVLLLSPFVLGERPSRRELLSVPVYALGLGLFFLDDLSPGQHDGNLLALASGVSFSLCILGLRALRENSTAALVWGNLMAAAVAIPFWPSGPHPRFLDLGIVGYLGVFQLGLSYLLFSYGLRRTKAVEASLLMLLEPVLNPIWTWLLAHERPGGWAIAGGTVILAATLWQTLVPALSRGAGSLARSEQ